MTIMIENRDRQTGKTTELLQMLHKNKKAILFCVTEAHKRDAIRRYREMFHEIASQRIFNINSDLCGKRADVVLIDEIGWALLNLFGCKDIVGLGSWGEHETISIGKIWADEIIGGDKKFLGRLNKQLVMGKYSDTNAVLEDGWIIIPAPKLKRKSLWQNLENYLTHFGAETIAVAFLLFALLRVFG